MVERLLTAHIAKEDIIAFNEHERTTFGVTELMYASKLRRQQLYIETSLET